MTTDYSKNDILFLGFDLSTQQLKIIVTDKDLAPLQTYNVEFDAQFKEKYNITKGVVNGDDGEVISPVGMWLDAMNYVFDEMKKDNFPFDRVVGISGSAQQHGSVYWSNEANELLSSLKPDESLAPQLGKAFSWDFSPNWQDHSTLEEANAFHDAIGKENLAKITGSRVHLRFTGLQIRKFATRSYPDKYSQTSRISLVSSFITSVLIGKIADLEESDACGMNLYDINKSDYDEELLALAAGVHPKIDNVDKKDSKYQKAIDDLKQKLGKIPEITYEATGKISQYFVDTYGFSPKTKIYSFTGDNLATILSLPLQPNDCLISLGTSTTVLIITSNYQPSSQYHLFKHPSLPKHYMGMLCYCNGALAREKARDEVNKKHDVSDTKSWDKFNEILDANKDFNNKLGIYFPLGEIIPQAPAQTVRAVLEDNKVVACDLDSHGFTVDDDASAIVESQTLSCRLRAGPMLSKSVGNSEEGGETSVEELKSIYSKLHDKFGDLYTDGKKQTFESLTARPNRCYYVGGASNNTSIIRKMGSIFGPTNGNYKVEIPNACALGGAYKASWSYECEQRGEMISYDKYIKKLFDTNDELESFKVDDKWVEYFEGVLSNQSINQDDEEGRLKLIEQIHNSENQTKSDLYEHLIPNFSYYFKLPKHTIGDQLLHRLMDINPGRVHSTLDLYKLHRNEISDFMVPNVMEKVLKEILKEERDEETSVSFEKVIDIAREFKHLEFTEILTQVFFEAIELEDYKSISEIARENWLDNVEILGKLTKDLSTTPRKFAYLNVFDQVFQKTPETLTHSQVTSALVLLNFRNKDLHQIPPKPFSFPELTDKIVTYVEKVQMDEIPEAISLRRVILEVFTIVYKNHEAALYKYSYYLENCGPGVQAITSSLLKGLIYEAIRYDNKRFDKIASEMQPEKHDINTIRMMMLLKSNFEINDALSMYFKYVDKTRDHKDPGTGRSTHALATEAMVLGLLLDEDREFAFIILEKAMERGVVTDKVEISHIKKILKRYSDFYIEGELWEDDNELRMKDVALEYLMNIDIVKI
ncbi:D-xylulokinase [Candida maltosa Xu316]|uniref:xylulokinase n=1 Tax=Candida maltosa (strain Xu316) TaxID=1245528 RepID=M3IKP2_CANMX|nr:D-xylulokinase [Candida maltosa Xu316]